MLSVIRFLSRCAEIILGWPVRIMRVLTAGVVFNPRLGPIRYLTLFGLGYVLFAFTLVYVAAPLRGVIGGHFMADKLRYDAERWLATVRPALG
jgi:penicillin-binding protein 1A